jgi:predicted hotdog family 3-hydroxylacyl-ACP dehydratase
MITEEQTITQFIPHRAPMIMVDKLISYHEKLIESSLTIQSNNVFVEDGVFTAPGMVENIAQTVAAGAGHNAVQNNEPTPLGFLAGVKSLKIHKLPPVGTDVRTKVQIINQVMNIGIVFGQVWQDNELAAECEMRIFIQK